MNAGVGRFAGARAFCRFVLCFLLVHGPPAVRFAALTERAASAIPCMGRVEPWTFGWRGGGSRSICSSTI